jgi:argininosuccinate lyase
MPQKKNPDVAELCRGKTGRVYGHLMALLTTMKGLPLAYNRDLQEDKEGLFDAVDTLLPSLEVFSGMLGSLKVNKDKMAAGCGGYILATDLADYLVGKGEAFRAAHGIVARLISYAAAKDKPLSELSLKEYREFSPLFDDGVYRVTAASAVAARNVSGGTAPQQVAQALARAKKAVGL